MLRILTNIATLKPSAPVLGLLINLILSSASPANAQTVELSGQEFRKRPVICFFLENGKTPAGFINKKERDIRFPKRIRRLRKRLSNSSQNLGQNHPATIRLKRRVRNFRKSARNFRRQCEALRNDISGPPAPPDPSCNPSDTYIHPFTEVTTSGCGWSVFTASSDTQIVYVSSSEGNDSTCEPYAAGSIGVSSPDDLPPGHVVPCKTLSHAYSLLRHEMPDWMLLKRGDVWTGERFGNPSRAYRWQLSGRSRSERMLVGSYGTSKARPDLRAELGQTFFTFTGGSNTPSDLGNIAITGLRFTSPDYDGVASTMSRAVNITLTSLSDLLVEDNYMGMPYNMVVRGDNIAVRRNVIVDAWTDQIIGASQPHTHGIYSAAQNFLVEENVVDRNGVLKTANGDIIGHTHTRNLYLNSPYITVKNNIITDSGSEGIQLRYSSKPQPGKAVRKDLYNNFFARNRVRGFYINGQGDDDPSGYIIASYNVVMDGQDISPSNVRGMGASMANVAAGEVRHNIIAHNVLSTGNHRSFELNGSGFGVHNLNLSDNIFYRWRGYAFGFNGSILSGITFNNNIVHEHIATRLVRHSDATPPTYLNSSSNKFFSEVGSATATFGGSTQPIQNWFAAMGDNTSSETEVNFLDPERSVASYCQHIGGCPGGNTYESFMARARQQSRLNYDYRYTAAAINDYIREGFSY